METWRLTIRPSLKSFLMFLRELASATSVVSLGSIQTLFLPHLSTEAAKRLWSLSIAILNVFLYLIIDTPFRWLIRAEHLNISQI